MSTSISDMFGSMALIQQVPKVYIGNESVDSVIHGIAILSVFFLMNTEKMTALYNKYRTPPNLSSITIEMKDRYSVYYLGINDHVVKNCPNIRNLLKPDHFGCEYEICGNGLLIEDDIYFSLQEKINNNCTTKSIIIYSQKHSVTFIKTILDKWVMEYKQSLVLEQNKSQYLFTVCLSESRGNSRKHEWQSSVTFQNRFFKNKQIIIDQIDHFINNKEWYIRKGIPHTLGILLHGAPGCGKTSFIKCLANQWPDKHIINIQLDAGISLANLEQLFSEIYVDGSYMIPLNKRIYVIEDVDCMGTLLWSRKEKKGNILIKGEEKIQGEGGKGGEEGEEKEGEKGEKGEDTSMCMPAMKLQRGNNLSRLLNIIDGLSESQERVIVFTSNYPQNLDEALLRPGRIDINICFENSCLDDIQNILRHYWDDDTITGIPDILCTKLSGAEVVNHCRLTKCYRDTIDLMVRTVKNKK